MCEEKRKLGFRKDVDKDLYILFYNESARVMDFCKTQQWHITVLGVGINIGLITIAGNFIPLINCCFLRLVLLVVMFVSSVLIPAYGVKILKMFTETIKEHREKVNEVLKTNEFLLLSEKMQLFFLSDSKSKEEKQHRDRLYSSLLKWSLIISTIIASLFLLSMNKPTLLDYLIKVYKFLCAWF